MQGKEQTLDNAVIGCIFDVRARLEALCAQASKLAGKTPGWYANGIQRMVDDIFSACQTQPHLSIAITLLRQEGKYSIRHMVDAAVVSNLVCRAMGMSDDEIRSVVSAALTMNIGMLEYQETLRGQRSPLTHVQRETLKQHPLKSVEMLREYGITDTLWFAAVEQHHEQIDGSGYPKKLAQDAVSVAARIVSLADVFCARIATRFYRTGLPSHVALRGILLERGKSLDQTITAHFIKTVGMYPPGMLVRLMNGENGVVIRTREKAHQQDVCILDERLQPLGPVRDTSLSKFEVVETYDLGVQVSQLRLDRIWA